MKIILRDEGINHYIFTTWFENLILCLKQWKYLQQKQQWTKNGKTWENSGVESDESQVRGGKKGKKALCFTDGHLSFERMLNWEAKYQKYKGRAVLRGDTVKDDSGSYAVLTEQGASASQMTAAKVMDINFKVTWMRRTSSWCNIC